MIAPRDPSLPQLIRRTLARQIAAEAFLHLSDETLKRAKRTTLTAEQSLDIMRAQAELCRRYARYSLGVDNVDETRVSEAEKALRDLGEGKAGEELVREVRSIIDGLVKKRLAQAKQ
jgi:hypothetical protein